ncbi:MAG: helix-turn-helix transcriptional regulator [Defluviitaleaceae bacterium]|nr:helix-turn-helix transcriptional regulator [Defluviitaleaceae bacterium]
MLAAGVTLSEYIRRRRLNGALSDLRSGAKIIDVAAKYGYESPDAFCVAFKRLYGITPSRAKKTKERLKSYDRIFFTLTVSYVKGENDMALLNIDRYRYNEPLFEGARIVLNASGASFTPEYIQGLSGAAFKIAGGCPSRPTCVCDYWTPDFIRMLGYEITELPCFDESGNDVCGALVEAVKKHIDGGRPALVWHAFTNYEYDVVCGYDDDAKQFVGRGTYAGNDEYARESWDRPKTCDGAPAFGAMLVGERTGAFDERKAELDSVKNAVKHARNEAPAANFWEVEGIKFYRQWADDYAKEGKERGAADAYCYEVYSSARKAGAIYLHGLAGKYDGEAYDCLRYAAACFERECAELDKARPYLSWASPWGIDEERSKNVAPLLASASGHYEKGVEYLEKFLSLIGE